MRSSETGEEIGGVSLYLPDDGTDRGEPHFKYHDPLYALGMSLPDGLTEEVDTMVTLWHNNTIYEWESVELTETGAETNVFSYDEGGVEITVTLDEGAEVTSEYDAFGATVYRSDQVSPARRTFFEETDETTCEFSSSVFGAQLVLVDGLASDEADIIQVMLFASTSSVAYDFIATEDGNNTKRFVSQDGLWFVDLAASYTPTANIDEAVVTVFGPATAEPQEIRVVETGNETNVLVTMEYIDSEDTDYPALASTVLHFVQIRRWPCVCGESLQLLGLSGAGVSTIEAQSDSDGRLCTPDIMLLPSGESKPELELPSPFVVAQRDSDLAAIGATSRAVGVKDCSAYIYLGTDGRQVQRGDEGKPPSGPDAFEQYMRKIHGMRKRFRIKHPKGGVLREAHADFFAFCIPNANVWDTARKSIRNLEATVREDLGHSTVYDQFVTHEEIGAFFVFCASKALECPVAFFCGHYPWTAVDKSSKDGLANVNPNWLRLAYERSTDPPSSISELKLRVLFIQSCGLGKEGKTAARERAERAWILSQLQPCALMTTSGAPYVDFTEYAVKTLFLSHDQDGPMGKYWPDPKEPTISQSYEKFAEQLEKAYSDNESPDEAYSDLSKWVDSYKKKVQEDYLYAVLAPIGSRVHMDMPNPEDERNENLDWREKARERVSEDAD